MRPSTFLACSAAVCAAWAATPSVGRDGIRTIPAAAAAAPSGTSEATVEPEHTRPAPAERASLAVVVDRAKVIRLPPRAQTVVIGNPAIADITVQKNGIVVVTGKSYGTTNLIALDAAGNMLAESNVSVAAPTENLLVVQRGFERQSYSCTPRCQPSVILGDSTNYFSENKAQAETRNQFAISR